MAEGSRGRGIFGSLLAGSGLIWVLWGFFGSSIGRQFGIDLVDLPIFPGLVIFFLGRALARGSGRGEPSSRRESPAGTQAPPRPEPQVRPSPVREKPRLEAPPVPEHAGVSEVIIEAFEAPEKQPPIVDAMLARKTSAEMVADARERYGKRP